MKEGEVLLLLSKTNGDWWQVGFLAFVGFQFEILETSQKCPPHPHNFQRSPDGTQIRSTPFHPNRCSCDQYPCTASIAPFEKLQISFEKLQMSCFDMFLERFKCPCTATIPPFEKHQ